MCWCLCETTGLNEDNCCKGSWERWQLRDIKKSLRLRLIVNVLIYVTILPPAAFFCRDYYADFYGWYKLGSDFIVDILLQLMHAPPKSTLIRIFDLKKVDTSLFTWLHYNLPYNRDFIHAVY